MQSFDVDSLVKFWTLIFKETSFICNEILQKAYQLLYFSTGSGL